MTKIHQIKFHFEEYSCSETDVVIKEINEKRRYMIINENHRRLNELGQAKNDMNI
jgi:hypothetical protein